MFTFQILSSGNFTDLEGSESQGWWKCETRYKALYGGDFISEKYMRLMVCRGKIK